MLKFIHAADFHMDSAFGALTARQAAGRRRESRELGFRLANYVNQNGIDLVLLAGDLFDSGGAFRETGEQLAEALGQMEAKVFIAPGNHDWAGPGSPWLTVRWPENVHVFREGHLTAVDLPEWNLTIHGAAFTGPERTESFLAGFAAPEDGRVHIGLLHGEIDPPEERYGPLHREEIAASGLSYLALGHIHKRTEPLRLGRTLCAWPGCVEMTIFIIVSAVFPNGHHLRPTVFPRDNVFTRMIAVLYASDTPTNVLPSIHVYNSIAIMIAVWRSKCFKGHKVITGFMMTLGVSIIFSTVLIKQHSMIDVLLAFILSGLMYSICYRRAGVGEKEKGTAKYWQ